MLGFHTGPTTPQEPGRPHALQDHMPKAKPLGPSESCEHNCQSLHHRLTWVSFLPSSSHISSTAIDHIRHLMDAVPAEIWSNILHSVPRVEQTKLLGVCRAFHDIALELVFQAIKIYFVGGSAAGKMLNSDSEEFVNEITQKLMIRSWELLRRITRDPSFARVVKSMTVIDASDSQSVFEHCMFLANGTLCVLTDLVGLDCLMDALDALPHLRTFRWFGASVGCSDDIAKHVPPTIQHLSLQT